MARKRKGGVRWGCLLLALGFYVFFRVFFTATAQGSIISTSSDRVESDQIRVRYSYEVSGKRYTGEDVVEDRYELRSGTGVKVRRWRFLHGMSSLSVWGLKVRPGHTFWDQVLEEFFEYVFAAIVAFFAVLLGLAPKKKKS